ncbi:hypothetical protein NDN08_006710 [Rhodosorus marinus]|uniref:tRNA (guanine(46)-N(7))-methyltransferase n=1 Tax=Rhodosorus marinus TaxID=101924 RepID=A0AAV8UMI9_9RHOD|nr:hypothetical protein NDN08_006710 [Rhodosorus marinus]
MGVVVASGQVRTRQHVNPLSEHMQKPVELEQEWPKDKFESLERTFHVDVGVAKGRFLFDMAEKYPEKNFLGLEIRKPLVDQANDWRDDRNLRNLDFIFCNANVSLDEVLSRLPTGMLDTISVQFPDPWFKKRHQKRRVLQPELVEVIAKHLKPSGELYVISDVLEVAEQMDEVVSANPLFVDSTPNSWIGENPFNVLTEREKACINHKRDVHGKLYTRA